MEQQPPEARRSPIRRLLRHLLRIGALLAAIALALIIAAAIYIVPRVASKHHAPRSPDTPTHPVADAEPILQFESHTCGFLALSAAYRVYGLSPEAKNIRFRLGVDREAHPFDEHSTGTLHPDLLRVLVQDGFEYAFLDLRTPDSLGRLRAHLDAGNLALVLITIEESGGLHWVLADELESGRLRIVDSLRREPYTRPARKFIDQRVLSVLLVRPARPPGSLRVADAYAAATAELARVCRRMRALSGAGG